MHRAFRDFDVVGFWADVQFWETQIQEWSLDYGSRLLVSGVGGPIAWDMRQSRRKVAGVHEAFMSAVLEGAVTHGVDPWGLSLAPAFKRHVMNAARVDTSAGVTFGKRGGRESRLKVDMYAAAMLAFGCREELRLTEALEPAPVRKTLGAQQWRRLVLVLDDVVEWPADLAAVELLDAVEADNRDRFEAIAAYRRR